MYVSIENTPLGASHECMNDSKNDLDEVLGYK